MKPLTVIELHIPTYPFFQLLHAFVVVEVNVLILETLPEPLYIDVVQCPLLFLALKDLASDRSAVTLYFLFALLPILRISSSHSLRNSGGPSTSQFEPQRRARPRISVQSCTGMERSMASGSPTPVTRVIC